ncbi:hypothetical protein AVEN_218978-1 [Araneus ventricosus]|uniref:Uncharacterized protein n=1 Tax=Araneus ventricosus TaxID=182803 RepID=A0A4Y2CDG3_ARAVE|nr:hypothetical protein AVEN_218978-1 [Araneus ventricosus]
MYNMTSETLVLASVEGLSMLVKEIFHRLVMGVLPVVRGSRWPSGKLLARGRKVSGSKPDSAEDSPYIRGSCTLNHMLGAKHPPAGVVWKF